MCKVSRNYNQDFSQYVKYDESSPTFLVRKESGDVAGSLRSRKNGDKFRVDVSICNKVYAGHRVIWSMFNSYIDPELYIDHLDGDPWNNNISNLRLVTLGDNSRNKKLQYNNITGTTGVHLTSYGYSVQIYDLGGARLTKHFSIRKYGEIKALSLAIEWRKNKLKELEQQGIFYSDRHGT